MNMTFLVERGVSTTKLAVKDIKSGLLKTME